MKRTILIGASRAQKLPALVCEYSIITRTITYPKVIQTWNEVAPEPKRKENLSRTGFSFQRFTLPRRANYEGIGIYLDSDMIALADIKELFGHVDAAENPLHCTRNLPAVIAMDCARTRWSIENILYSLDHGVVAYKDLLDLVPFNAARSIPDAWNCLDDSPKGAKIVHYTDMSRQCWRIPDHRPVSRLWREELRSAVQTGFIDPAIVDEEIALGHVIPEVKIDAGLE